MTDTTLWRDARLATLQPGSPWGWIEDGALLVQHGRIAWVGAAADLPADLARQPVQEQSLGGALLTPGLADRLPAGAPMDDVLFPLLVDGAP